MREEEEEEREEVVGEKGKKQEKEIGEGGGEGRGRGERAGEVGGCPLHRTLETSLGKHQPPILFPQRRGTIWI